MSPDIETRQNQPPKFDPLAQNNSPIAYGLGNFGLQAAFKVFAGYYMFFYVDGLGLAIALAAIINVVYALWDAVNDPLVGYLSDNTPTRPDLVPHPQLIEQMNRSLHRKLTLISAPPNLTIKLFIPPHRPSLILRSQFIECV